jgi:hypothetical protein
VVMVSSFRLVGASRNDFMRTEGLGFCQCWQERQLTVIRAVSGASAETSAARLQSCECDADSAMFTATGASA